MPVVQNNHMIKTLPPDRPDDSFAIAILPWRLTRDDNLFGAKHLEGIEDLQAVNAIPILNPIPRGRSKRKRLSQLQTRPV